MKQLVMILVILLTTYSGLALAGFRIAEMNRPVDDLARKLTFWSEHNAALGPAHWLPIANCRDAARFFSFTHARDAFPKGFYIDAKPIYTSGAIVNCTVHNYRKAGWPKARFDLIGTETIYVQ